MTIFIFMLENVKLIQIFHNLQQIMSLIQHTELNSSSHIFSHQDFKQIYMNHKSCLTILTSWNRSDFLNSETQADVLQHAFQMLDMKIKWLEFCFKFFNIDTYKLLVKSEQKIYTNSWICKMIFWWCEIVALKQFCKNSNNDCCIIFKLIYCCDYINSYTQICCHFYKFLFVLRWRMLLLYKRIWKVCVNVLNL